MKIKLFFYLVVGSALSLLANANLWAEGIKVAYSSISGYQAPVWISERAGVFKKNNVDAELIYIPGGSLVVQTLLSGDIGVASIAPAAAINAWQKGADLVLVAGGLERILQAVVANPKIKQTFDLKGKRIGISRFGSLTDVSLRKVLLLHKISPQEVQIVQTGGTGERMAGLTKGVIDAAVFSFDQVYQVEKLGFNLLFDLRKLPLSYPTQGLVSSRKFLESNRDTVKRFLKSYVEGINILKTNQEFSTKTLGKYLNVTNQEILAKTYELYREAFEIPPYVKIEAVVNAIDSSINPSKPLDTLIDNSLIDEVMKKS
jgi:ABC-type nitrate/sulfonate/bicarbonate transport system substrate-binding protein